MRLTIGSSWWMAAGSRPGQWALSRAYDINPAPMIDRAHGRQTPVGEDSPIGLGAAAEIEEAVARADRFGLRLAAARAIVGEVRAAIGRWRSIAARSGIADAALKAYAEAFDAP
jgi:serine/threonine-protein kinase HipA